MWHVFVDMWDRTRLLSHNTYRQTMTMYTFQALRKLSESGGTFQPGRSMVTMSSHSR